MTKIDVLIKVGGAVLTEKHSNGVIRYDLLDQICKVIRSIYDLDLKLAIVTGVGSIGHRVVAKYGVQYGDDGSIERRVGLLDAQIQVNELRNAFLRALKKAGVPAVQFYSSSIATSRGKELVTYQLDQVAKFIDSGLIPVVSGDVVPDETMGYSVLSGDVVFTEIFRQWGPTTLIYGTDVSGIHTSDPVTDTSAKLIRTIRISELDRLHADFSFDNARIDVSGAMEGKFKIITKMIQENPEIRVHILDLTQPENLIRVIHGEQFEHTIVQY